MTEKKEKVFEELLLEVRRVTRVTTWGRRLSFRAVVVIWDRKWKIGLWISKAQDVSSALQKAIHEAYKNIVEVSIVKDNTVPYPITFKYKAAVVKLIPASAGTWLKAWSSVRSVLDLAWYNNILSKIIWTNNRLNNALATIYALSRFKKTKAALKKKEELNSVAVEIETSAKSIKVDEKLKQKAQEVIWKTAKVADVEDIKAQETETGTKLKDKTIAPSQKKSIKSKTEKVPEKKKPLKK